jgi:hypothetical protein
MKIGELLTVDTIADADFDFEKCDKKEILSKMLENQTPKSVKRFSSKGTCWSFGGEFYDEFDLYINGALLGTSNLVSDFIDDFLNFLPHLAYTNDKKLICPFEYEGIITAFITTPIDDNNIRVSVFKSGEIYKKYRPEYRFGADIVINKNVFLKQMYNLLQKMVKDTEEKLYNENVWISETKFLLSELDKYFENPELFKKRYEPQRHIRVFDVAYKDLDNTWQFTTVLDNDRDSNPIHWEREKQQGNILDYDIFEQYPKDMFDWDTESKCFKKLTEEEIKEKLKNYMNEREDNNWVYSAETKKWYAPNEIMPHSDDTRVRCVYHGGVNYEIKIGNHAYLCEDEELKNFIERSYDIDGELTEDNLGFLGCVLILKNGNDKFAEIEFDYRNYKQIRECLNKVKDGEYARLTLDGNSNFKLHMWQYLYDNSESKDATDLKVACYDMRDNKELYIMILDKQNFIDCFTQALDEIAHKLEITKHLMEVGEKLKIKDKFTKGKDYKFNYIEPFKGDYACVYKYLYGWGIINKNLEWVSQPETVTIFGEEHPKWGKEIKGFVTKYSYLHNIDGKLFIASRNNGEEFVMDIKGDIQIPHVAEKIYYQYLNNNLYFIAVNSDKTLFINSKGEVLFQLDFKIGEKFWLFDDIVIISKDEKYGIVDWRGKLKADYIFSEIIPNKDSLDFIPVKYIDRWGFINKNGKIIKMKIEDE